MWSWRAFGASALFALTLLSPGIASAQNHQLRVPVSLEGLPPTLDRLWGYCRFTDAAGVETYGGNVDRPITGGRFVDTVTFDMRRNSRRGSDTPEGYYCHLRIMGRTASGEPVTFASDGPQAALGWLNMYGSAAGRAAYYLPSAPGTMISRAIHGRFEKPEQTAPPASTSTECPCGCTASGGAAACSTDATPPPAPASSPPSSPSTPPALRLPTPISPARVTTPAPAPLRAGAALPTGRIDLTTSRFAYTGTGVIVTGR